MLVAILGLNIGVMAVATALSSTDVSAGLGLGLFGVLSIIRVRSAELRQEEVAYYFSSLALGLLAGFTLDPLWLSPALMAVIIAAMYLGDHPRLFANRRHQSFNLDVAYTDEAKIIARLEELLGFEVLRIRVKRVDLVNDTTSVDVHFRCAPVARPAHAELDPIETSEVHTEKPFGAHAMPSALQPESAPGAHAVRPPSVHAEVLRGLHAERRFGSYAEAPQKRRVDNREQARR